MNEDVARWDQEHQERRFQRDMQIDRLQFRIETLEAEVKRLRAIERAAIALNAASQPGGCIWEAVPALRAALAKPA